MSIAPKILFNDVRATAAWALEPGFTQASYQEALLRLDRDVAWPAHEYFKSLLAAHFTTCATFSPTNVDQVIRFHIWQDAKSIAELDALIAVAYEAIAWPVPEVSDRCVKLDQGIISGHAGEWFSVLAGALGRAHALGAGDRAEELRGRIERELRFQIDGLQMLAKTPGKEIDAICAIANIAHNLGDLARVCDMWPNKDGTAAADVARYSSFPKIASIADAYKDLCADSNHRYLPLRAAKSLRKRRDFLLPLGPCLDAWGEHVARHSSDPERAEILAGLLEGHAAASSERGYLRAISGMNRGLKGGVDAYERDLPARLRKTLRTGLVRPALDLDAHRFNERMRARFVSTHRARIVATPFA
jgi:hypothetical protein